MALNSTNMLLTVAVALLLVIASTRIVVVASTTTAFDHDIRENCEDLVLLAKTGKNGSPCIEQDSRLYFQCPISCAKALRRTTMDDNESSAAGHQHNKHGHSQNPDPFYDASIMIMTSNKNEFKMLSCDRFEGYVTLVATVPLLSNVGFVQFHYEMLQHIHSVFPYTIEILFLPLLIENKKKKIKSSSAEKKSSDKDKDHVFQYLEQITTQKTMTIEKNGSGQEDKIVVAEPVKDMAKHPVLQYLLNPIYGPNKNQNNILADRKAATFYVMSIDGRHWEELISPTLTDVELCLAKFLHELDPPVEHIPIE